MRPATRRKMVPDTVLFIRFRFASERVLSTDRTLVSLPALDAYRYKPYRQQKARGRFRHKDSADLSRAEHRSMDVQIGLRILDSRHQRRLSLRDPALGGD